MEFDKKTVTLSIILLLIIFLIANLNLTGYTTKNKLPVVTLSRPVDDAVVNNKTVEFIWNFQDAENNEQTAYILQISNNNSFDPTKDIIQEVIEINNKDKKEVAIKDIHSGKYYWRVKVKDTADWGEFSKYYTFNIDLSPRTCTDNTPFYECSKTKPFYCNGDLFRRCSICGCPTGFKCQSDETCIESPNCIDSTKEGACSLNKPKYCQDNNLVDKCSICGCDSNEICENDKCQKQKQEIEQPIEIQKIQKSFIQKIIDFFKKFKIK